MGPNLDENQNQETVQTWAKGHGQRLRRPGPPAEPDRRGMQSLVPAHNTLLVPCGEQRGPCFLTGVSSRIPVSFLGEEARGSHAGQAPSLQQGWHI